MSKTSAMFKIPGGLEVGPQTGLGAKLTSANSAICLPRPSGIKNLEFEILNAILRIKDSLNTCVKSR